MDNRGKVIAMVIPCAECNWPVLFSTNSKKRPDEYYENKAPLHVGQVLDGKKGTCQHCGTKNRAFMNYHSIPPMLCSVQSDNISELEH